MGSSWKLSSVLIIMLATCIHEGFSIKCWSCRSDEDPKCNDKFDNSTVQIDNCEYLPELSHLPGVKATMCRKIRQKVDGVMTIIRGCAYLGEIGVDGNEGLCLKSPRGGETFMEYCTCDNKDGCNTGATVYSNQLIQFAAFLICFVTRFCNM